MTFTHVGVLHQVPPGHWFKQLMPAYWLLLRTECSCGWRSRACLTADGCANKLIMHYVFVGQEEKQA